MMTARRKAVLKQFAEIILWLFVVHLCVMVMNIVRLYKNDSVDDLTDNVALKCEKTWNQVLKSRERKFTSLIDPTHLVVNQFLEIVEANRSVCEGILEKREASGDVRIAIIVVNSVRRNFNARKIIRESWGSMKQWNDWEIRTLFVLGQSEYCLKTSQKIEAREKAKDEEDEIQNELEKFGDIVLGSFTDSLRNNTYKHLIGYRFVLESCPQAELIVKTEDNIFLNLPEVLKTRSENSYDMLCESSKNLWPVRCSKCATGKYFVTEKEWPSDRYPTHCQGNVFAVSKEFAEDLYEARGLAGFFWIDQVFISGLLREAAEKEFGKETKLFEVNGMVKKRKGGEKWLKQLCKNGNDQSALKLNRKELGIYETVEGNWMGCLWNIVSGI